MITRVSSAMQRWLVIRSDDMSSCSCMQLVSHMFAPRLRWPRDRDPDECNLQARFATCSLARISSLASPAQQHCDAFVARQIANNAGAMPLCSASWGTRARTSLIAIEKFSVILMPDYLNACASACALCFLFWATRWFDQAQTL